MLQPRFENDFTFVGDVTVTPDDELVSAGTFTLGAGEDILWVAVEQRAPAGPAPFSYGILGFQTANGYELGTQKCWPRQDLTVYRLSVGLAPALQYGQITFEPRSFNLRWIQAGNPWTLRFFARGGTGSVSPDPGVVASFADSSDGGGLSLVQVDYSGRIK